MAAGISLPPRRVEQHMPPNSGIAGGLQPMMRKIEIQLKNYMKYLLILLSISFNITLHLGYHSIYLWKLSKKS